MFRVSVIIKHILSYLDYYNENKIILIKYEDIINNTTETLKKICNHLNVDYSEEMKNTDTLFLDEKQKNIIKILIKK